MDWNLEGMYVKGMYLGEHPCQGHVVMSRVTYGGAVKHTVVLDKPIKITTTVDGSEVFSTHRDRVLLNHRDVQVEHAVFESVNLD